MPLAKLPVYKYINSNSLDRPTADLYCNIISMHNISHHTINDSPMFLHNRSYQRTPKFSKKFPWHWFASPFSFPKFYSAYSSSVCITLTTVSRLHTEHIHNWIHRTANGHWTWASTKLLWTFLHATQFALIHHMLCITLHMRQHLIRPNTNQFLECYIICPQKQLIYLGIVSILVRMDKARHWRHGGWPFARRASLCPVNAQSE